jgi:hypothetical protein
MRRFLVVSIFSLLDTAAFATTRSDILLNHIKTTVYKGS